ncbi:light-sensor Protein kinase-like [Daphnia pulicaria]|uniref:light-sensor Protein kinase-like n=1 Tax=Daphnia pulicaria TaxID=35523 RepID=UPI001EEB1D4C|nr:light-sensor Protein kinase-like [Daphnia pulicaria]
MPTAKDVLLQLARGLEHIHKKGLVHRDLKPENVLIWVDPNTQKVLMKWADFGLSKRVNEKGSYSMQSGVKGTLDYSAPEILKLLEKEDTSTSTDGTTSPNTRGNIKSDVFAEGLVFGYFLLGGVHLFYSGSRYHIQSNIIEKEPPNLPKIQFKDIRTLIQKMLEKDPHKRITSSDVTQELQEIEMSINNSIFAEDTYPSLEEVEILLQKEMDINSVDEKGLTPLLHLALPKKNEGDNLVEIFRLLITKGANVHCETENKMNALHLLCEHYKNENFIDLVKLLIEKGINVNCEKKRWNAFNWLCKMYPHNNLLELVKVFIASGIKTTTDGMLFSSYVIITKKKI